LTVTVGEIIPDVTVISTEPRLCWFAQRFRIHRSRQARIRTTIASTASANPVAAKISVYTEAAHVSVSSSSPCNSLRRRLRAL